MKYYDVTLKIRALYYYYYYQNTSNNISDAMAEFFGCNFPCVHSLVSNSSTSHTNFPDAILANTEKIFWELHPGPSCHYLGFLFTHPIYLAKITRLYS